MTAHNTKFIPLSCFFFVFFFPKSLCFHDSPSHIFDNDIDTDTKSISYRLKPYHVLKHIAGRFKIYMATMF